MKRLACFLLICAMVFTIAAFSEDFDATYYTYDELISIREAIDNRIKELEELAAQAIAATERFKVYIDVASEDYFFSDIYDVELYIDNDLIATIPNGGEFYKLLELTKGTHDFIFYKKSDHKVRYSMSLDVSMDITYTCDIVHEDKISLTNEQTHIGLSDVYFDLTDKTGMILNDANKALKKDGFINVSYEPYSDIWNTDNWIVISQNPKAASDLDKHEKIVLTCVALEDYLNSQFVGKDADSITQYCKSLGISCAYRDADSWDKLTSQFEKMSKSEMESWAVDSVSYGSKSATIYVRKSQVPPTMNPIASTPTPTKEPAPTPAETPQNITVENNPDFAKYFTQPNEAYMTCENFVKAHKNEYVEFDGYVLELAKHGSYKTRFDVTIAGFTSYENMYKEACGMFSFIDVNFYDMNVTGSDTVTKGLAFHIIGEVIGISEDGLFMELDPVSMQYLDSATYKKSKVATEAPVATTESSQEQCPFDYMYKMVHPLYSVYYLFDIDTNIVIYYTTDDTGTSVGKLEGDASTNFEIYIDGEYYGSMYPIGIKNQTKAILIDYAGFDWEWDPADYSEVVEYFNKIGFIYDPGEFNKSTVRTTKGCNARKAPNYSGEAIAWISDPQEFPLIEEKNGWYLVELPDGKQGYIPAESAVKVVK